MENGIGVGTVLQIIKSGDVIPNIHKIMSSENYFKMPTFKGHNVSLNQT